MRCRTFFSAAIRQVSGAWPSFLDNKSWIPLFFTPVALSYYHLLFPCHSKSNPLLSFLPVSLTFFFCLFSMSLSPTEICAADCGGHGVCVSGSCRCDDGWMGSGCDQRACHPRCNEHGTCKDGKCECSPGWNGEHCTIGRMGTGVLWYGTLAMYVCMCLWRDLRVNTNVAGLSACVRACEWVSVKRWVRGEGLTRKERRKHA